MDKPAMGCRPYYVAVSDRIAELCEAIKRAEGGKNDQVRMWATEIQLLNEVDRHMRHISKQKVFFEEDE